MITFAPTTTFAIGGIPDRATVLCNATSGAFQATLPSAVTYPGIERTIVKTDSGGNAVTVGTTSSQTILTTTGTATTASLAAQGNAITVISDGANWVQISKV